METAPAQQLSSAAKGRAGIPKAGGSHALGHALTTPGWEGGTDLAPRQRVLGHESVPTPLPSVPVARSPLSAHGAPRASFPDVSAAGSALPPLASLSTATGVPGPPSPPPCEGADVVRAYGAAVRATPHVAPEQARVLRAIAQGRTAA